MVWKREEAVVLAVVVEGVWDMGEVDCWKMYESVNERW